MRSFTDKTDNRRAVYLNLVSSIEGQLREAYERLHAEGQETRSSLARKLGVHRSVVTRRLTGGQNMTIETIADMVWALGKCIKVDIFDPDARYTNEALVIPQPSEPSLELTHQWPSAESKATRSVPPRGGARVQLSADKFQDGMAESCQ